MLAFPVIKMSLIIFWGMWYLIVAATDIVSLLDYMKHGKYVRFNSNNIYLIEDLLKKYHISSQAFLILSFILIILASFFASISAFYGLYYMICYESKNWIEISFIFSLILHLSFILVGEIFVSYTNQSKHIIRIIFILISCYIIFRLG